MGDPQVTMVLILRFLPTWMIWGSRTITLKGNADDLGSESKDLAGWNPVDLQFFLADIPSGKLT